MDTDGTIGRRAGGVLIAALAAIAWGAAADSGSPPVNTGYFGGVAINGYDPVGYFTQAQAVKGSPEFAHDFLGVTWHFASREHRDLFTQDPIRYAPQYGGYCAGEMVVGAVTSGITTNIDPTAWRIINGKLYLFYDQGYAGHFADNAAELVAKADSNWPDVAARLSNP